MSASGGSGLRSADAPPASSSLSSPRPIPGLTSSSSGWQWRLCWRSWQRRRLLTKPFLSGFSPFLARWQPSPAAGLVAGLSVIAGGRGVEPRRELAWSGHGAVAAGRSGDSTRAADDSSRATNSQAPSLTRTRNSHTQLPHTHTHMPLAHAHAHPRTLKSDNIDIEHRKSTPTNHTVGCVSGRGHALHMEKRERLNVRELYLHFTMFTFKR